MNKLHEIGLVNAVVLLFILFFSVEDYIKFAYDPWVFFEYSYDDYVLEIILISLRNIVFASIGLVIILYLFIKARREMRRKGGEIGG